MNIELNSLTNIRVSDDGSATIFQYVRHGGGPYDKINLSKDMMDKLLSELGAKT